MPSELARVAVAAGIAVVGFFIATGIRLALVRLFGRLTSHLSKLTHSASERAGVTREATSKAEAATLSVIGRIVFWIAFSLFLGAATTVLGLPQLSAWLADLAGYLPHLLAAAAIVLLGVMAGFVLRTTVIAAAQTAGFPHARSLGRTAQFAVIALASVIAIEELGIQMTFLLVVAATLLGATLGGAALAFGLGARDSVRNILASHYLAKWYRVGQTVRIGAHEGRIVEILPAAVILQTDAGRVYVPASDFSTATSVLLTDEDA